MENKDIMNNVEVMDEVLEVVPVEGSGNGWKMAGGALLIAGVIYGGYKLVKFIKAKREADNGCVYVDPEDVEDVNVAK